MSKAQEQLSGFNQTEIREPSMFKVLLINDNYTTFDFVVEVLCTFFYKTTTEAKNITLTIHKEGKGIAGIYSRDMAETKMQQVNGYARKNGHPLLCEVEPV